MIKTKNLPCLRIDSRTDSLMKSALEKLNQNSLINICLADFRRICYEFTSAEILKGVSIKLDK